MAYTTVLIQAVLHYAARYLGIDHGLQRAFAAFVWDRDHSRCRWCGRRVIRSLDRVDTRGEVHHIHGRLGRLKFEPRAALLLCGTCHDKLTGRVNEKWKVMGTRYWTLDGATVIDATVPVDFVRIA
jgi:hypothetical protein